MINLIKMDFRRLLRSVSFLVMIFVVLALAFFDLFMIKTDLNNTKNDPIYMEQLMEEETNQDEVSVSMGIIVDTNVNWINGDIELLDLTNVNVASGLLLILCSIFTALFVNAEQKSGFIKNIAGQLSNRGGLILSKLAATAFLVLMILALYTSFTALAGAIFFGDQLVLSSIPDLLKILGIQYLLHLGFSTVILLLCIFTKSTALSMTVGILCSTHFSTLLYGGINKLVYEIAHHDELKFDVSKYTLETNINLVSSTIDNKTILQIILVSCAWIVFSTACSMIFIQKRDVR